jgi:amidase
MTVKESFNVSGLRTTWGLPAFRDWTPPSESLAIRRLKAAGAVIHGKTNLSAGCADWQCENSLFGRTNNPWDLSRTPGGSSGGSAAAIAAGFSLLELGSDLAGSIRIPAAFCGVFGHRPSHGILSSEGYGFPGTFASSDLSTIGPLARSATDLMLVFELLAGPGSAESTAWRVSLPESRRQRLGDYRVLIVVDHPLVRTQHQVQENLKRLAADLECQGARVATSSPLLPDLAEATRICVRLLVALTLSRVSDEQWDAAAERARQLDPEDAGLAAVGLRAGTGTHRSWLRAHEQRARLALLWRRFFQEYDLLITPAAPTSAFPHDDRSVHARLLQVDGGAVPYFDQMAWAALPIACGLPATTIPFHRDSDGLPLAFQAIGPYLEDRTPIEFAIQLERHLGPRTYIPE